MPDHLETERNYWRALAAYLASCHAATAEYDGSLSSVSGTRKARFAAICKTAAEGMTVGGWRPDTFRTGDPDEARNRCLKAREALGYTD